MKNKRGITLIALIITIIVMLILVGVTVNVALNGGLFSTAKQAARKTQKAILNEELTTIIAAMNADINANNEKYIERADEYGNINGYILETALIKLEENFIVDETVILTENDGTRDIRVLDLEGMNIKGLVTVDETAGMYILTVPCKYKENDVNIIVEIKMNEDSLKIVYFSLNKEQTIVISQTGETPTVAVGENIKSLTEDGVPIPKGFYYVTGTMDTGVVISDNQEDENNESGNNGNQFVWVPVKVNPKLEIKIDSDKDIKTVRILNSDGYDETIDVNSDIFEKTIDLTNNGAYEVIATYQDGSVEDELYEINNVYQKLYTPMLEIKTLGMLGGMTEEKTLDTLKEVFLQNNPDAVLNTKIDLIKEYGKQEDLQTEDSAIETESVLKYGGFYIGRYEVGTDETIKRGNYPKSNISYEDAKSKAEAMYSDNTIYGVKSGMISAAAWDSVGKWLVNSGSRTWEDIYYSSTSWGNYRPSGSWTVHGSLKNSGSSEQYSANNIYDLAGNLREWSTEIKIGETGNIARGSYYDVGGYPNFYSKDVETAATTYTGYRPILYFY